MQVTCGIDWAEDHHDVAVVDSEARLLGRLRVSDDASGFQDLLRLLAEHGDTPDEPIPIAIETSRGLMVACLRASGRQVFAINPMAVARYRDRHAVSRKKSDHQDAVVVVHGHGEHHHVGDRREQQLLQPEHHFFHGPNCQPHRTRYG